MKNNLLLIITHCLIATSSCIAMESELNFTKWCPFEKPKIISEITCVEQPWQAEYLDEDRVLINGVNGCYIINPTTNGTIEKLDIQTSYGVQAPPFTIHPTKKTIAFSGKNSAIYSNTGKLENLIPIRSSQLAFDPLNNHLLINKNQSVTNEIVIYDYTKNENKNFKGSIPLIAFHPTKKILFQYQSPSHNLKSKIEIYNSTTLEKEKEITLINPESYAAHMLCNLDGSLIAVQDANNDYIYIIKNYESDPVTHRITLPTLIEYPFNQTECATFRQSHYGKVISMIFHPNSSVLATSMRVDSDSNYTYYNSLIIFYWDVTTQQLITKTQPFPYAPSQNRDENNIAFSPNGTKLLIVLYDKCIILPVPVEVLITKSFYTWFLLKEGLNQHNIPTDVYEVIGWYLLETFKR